jgi:hypothetical protein
MKTFKEWVSEIAPEMPLAPTLTEWIVLEIQADALEHAAGICETQTEPRAGEESDFSDGDANRGVANCQDAIRVAAKSLRTAAVFSLGEPH